MHLKPFVFRCNAGDITLGMRAAIRFARCFLFRTRAGNRLEYLNFSRFGVAGNTV